MFGEFDLSFKETITTVSFGLLTVAPTIFAKLQDIFDPKTQEVAGMMAGINHNHKWLIYSKIK